MDRTVFLNTTASAQFLAALNEARENSFGKAQHRYILCTAVLAKRRRLLAKLKRKNLDTTKQKRMISRLEASQAAHLRLVRKLEQS